MKLGSLRATTGKMIILDGARETLVLLGIIVLQDDLEFHRLLELPLFLLTVLEHIGNGVVQQIS